MTERDLQAALRHGATLVLDSNTVRKLRTLEALTRAVQRWNSEREAEQKIRLRAPTLVHAEVVHHHQRARSTDYRYPEVINGLLRLGIELEAFDGDFAQATGSYLAGLHPGEDDWSLAKRRNALRQLKIPHETFAELCERQNINADRLRCSATVDWFIAGHAVGAGRWLVSDDQGDEFIGVRRLTLVEARNAVEGLVKSLGVPVE